MTFAAPRKERAKTDQSKERSLAGDNNRMSGPTNQRHVGPQLIKIEQSDDPNINNSDEDLAGNERQKTSSLQSSHEKINKKEGKGKKIRIKGKMNEDIEDILLKK